MDILRKPSIYKQFREKDKTVHTAIHDIGIAEFVTKSVTNGICGLCGALPH